MKNKKETEKYIIKKNNYIGLLFFALVLASTLYIIKHETNIFLDINKKVPEETTKYITPNDAIIEDLRNYLNPGDINTYTIYQSPYIYNDTVENNDLNDESVLYTAYLYINKTNDIIAKERELTCEEAESINLTNIKECNTEGTESLNDYKVNSFITKNMMKTTIRKIFNRNIDNYTDFYINKTDKCHLLNEIYLCVIHDAKDPESYTETKLVSARQEENNIITIIEKYNYYNTGINYKGFTSNEIGEGTYKSTFKKMNGSYYWVSTEYIDN